LRLDPSALPEAAQEFLTERHLATLTTTRWNGDFHVVPVGFTYDPATVTARVITSGDSVKARNAGRNGATAALCSVDRVRWITLVGPIRVETSADAVADAERRYTERYRPPRVNPKRVVLIMDVRAISASNQLGRRSR
jgi:PPOX class probable F420-dependent enzyme